MINNPTNHVLKEHHEFVMLLSFSWREINMPHWFGGRRTSKASTV